MRRFTRSLVLLAAILVIGGMAAGCGSAVKGAIASLSPSRSATFSPSRSASPPASPIVTATPSAQPSATPSAAAPTAAASPASSPAAGSGSSSGLIWLWVLLGAVILIGVIVWIARSAGRRSAAAAGWRSRVVDAYAKGSALYDAMSIAESPGALAAADAGARWSDIQRRADNLAQTLYAMREAAPSEDDRVRVVDTLTSLQAVRSAMDAERAPGGAGPQHAEMVRGRLRFFEASLRALRAADEPMP
jgi:hypothetical protein